MEELQRNIDEVFRKSLGDYREAPPPGAWSQVSRRLDEEDKGRRRTFLHWPWVALSLLAVVGCAWMVVGLSLHGLVAEESQRKAASPGVAKYAAVPEQPAIAMPVAEVNVQGSKLTPVKEKSPQSRNIQPDKQSATFHTSAANIYTHKSTTKEAGNIKTTIGNSTSATSLRVTATNAAQTIAVATTRTSEPVGTPSIAVEQAPQVQAASQMPDAERNGPLAFTNSGDGLTHEKLPTPVALQPLPLPPLAAIEPSPNASLKEIREERRQRAAAMLAAKGNAAAKTTTALAVKTGKAEMLAQVAAPAAASQTLAKSASASTNPDVAAGQNPNNEKVQVPLMPRVKAPFSIAVLGGYEQRLHSTGQAQFSLAARLLWSFGSRLSIGVQPAFRYGQLATTQLSQDAAYQRSAWRIDSFRTGDLSPTIRGRVDSIYNYVIHQIYDSIVIKGRSFSGSFWEVELPVIVRYQLSKQFAIWGGPSLVFGGRLTYTEDGAPQVYFTERKDSIAQSIQRPAEEFLNYFGTSSLPQYSSYNASGTPEDAAMLRLGYLFGVGFTQSRWLAEASLHGQLSGYGNQAQPARDVYAHPNVRLSIGYLLFKSGTKALNK